jgi:succinyl-diaminopimelate desuccinylase
VFLDFLDLCREFISYDTTPAVGNAVLARRAGDLCREIGLETQIFEESVGDVMQINMVARTGKEPVDRLVLQTHLDTREPGAHRAWSKTGSNPFNATVYEGRLYGLGAVDAKLDFLCKWQALRELQDRNFVGQVALVGTYGEETGMQGAARLIRRKDLLPENVLVGAPTDLQIIGAGKGIVLVDISIPFSADEIKYKEHHNELESTTTQSKVFRGVATHSSAPTNGENAITKMLDYLADLPQSVIVMDMDGGISANSVPSYAFFEMDLVGHLENNIREKVQSVLAAIRRIENEFPHYRDDDFSPPHPTLNIGMVRTYGDHICLSGCFRMPPSVNDSVYKGWMRQLKADCEAVQSLFRIVDYKAPFRLKHPSDFTQVCTEGMKGLQRSSEMGTIASATEASVFTSAGAETIVFGPGSAQGRVHIANESVSLADLTLAKNYYRFVLENFCL